MASKRIFKELMMLQKKPLEYVDSINPLDSDQFAWDCTVMGPSNSPYAGGKFVVRISFPAQYPFKAPTLKFVTKVYHPSVKLDTGDICADVVGKWGPTLNAKHILGVIYSMLQSPEADHPLEETIAAQLRDKPKEFEKTAKKYTKEYGM
mmetsp:Transcript_20033/g.46848  ORF Transcript_20033/g.46848 Transcript_20033/m.46848 type:complete len:149 (+) Transcript_20033:273-719(+)|eukprot:CAMPEP_0172390024 /NCGR_PEP_ID=MMETSP1061-20121228/6780_1 /TAXON_ID=37318 /ORGANISM="Pseudo-nitzschia pungens, Strain cf. pungens" /LENGTH=148 /DNA_ID=CAMNT_0013120301 /DNA_START=436 /DNA_END=882 /DNA_ORIENTATION=+